MKACSRRCFRPMALVAALAAACSGAKSPTQPPINTPPTTLAPVPPPTTLPSTPPTTLPGPSASSCSIGKGDVDARCARSAPRLLGDVEAAIDRVVREQPQLFNLREEISPGGYRVLDKPAYLQAVAAQLAAAGFCAQLLDEELQVKNSQDFSEEYDVVTASGFIRRGAGAYVQFCSPAAFPLLAEDVIHRVHIFPVGIECTDTRTSIPTLDRRELPVGCLLIVTATPKDKNLVDVDPRLHGPDIKWDMPVGDFRIKVEDYPGVAFNKRITGLEPGDFAICAEVKSVAGCLNAKVIP
jgi:hypothetical protein